MSRRQTIPGADDIFERRWPNGVRLLARRNPGSPAVVLAGFLPAGGQHDPADRLGLASLTARALSRGTQRFSFQEFYAALEDVGADLGFSAGITSASFNGRALAEDLPLLLDLLSDALRRPTFPVEPVLKLREQVLTGLALRDQDTESMAALTFDRLIYGAEHPYGRPASGFRETVAAIEVNDLRQFHARHYGPRGLTLVVVGAVDPEALASMVAERFGDWNQPSQPAAAVPPRVSPPEGWIREHVHLPAKQQVDLVLGTTAPGRTDPDFEIAMLANVALGQFGMMGRIGEAVRERAGLAYYAYSNLSATLGTGTWDVSAGVNAADFDKAVELIVRELRVFVEEGLRPDELEEVRQGLLARLPLSLEANAGVLSALLNIARYDLGLDYYRLLPERLQAVTCEQVHEVIHRYLDPDALVLSSAGTLEGA